MQNIKIRNKGRHIVMVMYKDISGTKMDILDLMDNFETIKDSDNINFEKAINCAQYAINLMLNSGTLEPQLKRHYMNGDEPSIIMLEYWHLLKGYINSMR